MRTKDKIFHALASAKGSYISGEQLAAGIPLTLEKRSGVVWFYHKVSL